MRKTLDKIISAANMNADIVGPAMGLDQDFGYAVQANYTTSGSLGGTFKLQASLDYNPGTPQSGGAFNAGNWVDISGSPETISGAGTFIWNAEGTFYPWVRLIYTHFSGDTGSLDVYFFNRGF